MSEQSPLICLCQHVREDEILAAIERGHRDLPAVRLETGANSGCGDCAIDIEDLLATAVCGRGAGEPTERR
ncbi:(2Fe-2S)-binding protein [Micromonospora sp. KLBMP9576]|uniref:(2Fe-2S)-binding protein n=1 Tax=Micromonospora sp. KLBMP9576 TaxID=3424769 RepID=UPI003D9032E3